MVENGIFGAPPADLVTVPGKATQFSPFFPGGERLEDVAEGQLRSFVMFAPPGTIERLYNLALALRALSVGGQIVVLAPKDKGGSRIAKELKVLGCSVEEEAKRHHRICVALRPVEIVGLEAALAEGSARLDQGLGLNTQPGVFSWNRLDPGSALLLKHLPAQAGRGADLGSGLGILSRKILESREVAHLTLVELDRRAVECARSNVNLSRCTIHWADLRNVEIKPASLDFVVSNPPFHDGGLEDRALGEGFLRRSAEFLKPGGHAWIVANRHLPYEPVLASLFKSVTVVDEGNGYKIFRAQK